MKTTKHLNVLYTTKRRIEGIIDFGSRFMSGLFLQRDFINCYQSVTWMWHFKFACPSGLRGLQRRQRTRYKGMWRQNSYVVEVLLNFILSTMLIWSFTFMKCLKIKIAEFSDSTQHLYYSYTTIIL